MLISEKWLNEWVRPGVSGEALGEMLTLAGLEMGGMERVEPLSDKIVVGEIVEATSHPKANKLKVCRVNVGRDRPVKIVCGAPNAREGLKSPVALPGAVLPGGARIRRTEIRGEASQGMLCSAMELGLEEASDTIMELDANAKVGTLISDHLGLDDCVIDIDLTPNRGDCLSIRGVARETAAIARKALKETPIPPVPAETDSTFPISLEATEDCPRYVGRVIEGVDVAAPTPDWMKERLRRCGLRSISIVVDITNYVMLELGQPMHAFDHERLNTGIVVRQARRGEKLKLLDGSQVKLEAGTLLICDGPKPVALAGIMGGEDSAIGDDTRDILFESAFFRPGAIAGRARTLGMQTDASHRFERGVDPEGQEAAVERATALLVKIAGGRPGPVMNVVDKPNLPKRPMVTLRRRQLDRMLGFSMVDKVRGVAITDKKVTGILTRLGMKVTETASGWRAKPPSFRFDISGEHDLIEEVARVVGYDAVPVAQPHAKATRGLDIEERLPVTRVEQLLVNRDYREVITYSFVEEALQSRINPETEAIALTNPIAANMSVMRTSLWSGLLTALSGNYRRQHRRIRLFETGHVFLKKGRKRTETLRVGGIVSGPRNRAKWDSDNENVDFFDIKGDVESLLSLSGALGGCRFVAEAHPALHPGQSAAVMRGKQQVGYLGRLHPDLQRHLDVDQSVYLFELDLDPLLDAKLPQYQQISRFPTVRRDLSIVVGEETTAREVEETLAKAGGELLKKIELFDVYRGKGVEKNRKSLAYGLTLQANSRNLTDSEIDEIIHEILKSLKKALGGELRA